MDNANANGLDRWLRTATRGLCIEAQERVTSEVTVHYTEACQDLLDAGSSPDEAGRNALDALGSARKARRAFRRTYLTKGQAYALKLLSLDLNDQERWVPHNENLARWFRTYLVCLAIVLGIPSLEGVAGILLEFAVFFAFVYCYPWQLWKLRKSKIPPRVDRAAIRRTLLWRLVPAFVFVAAWAFALAMANASLLEIAGALAALCVYMICAYWHCLALWRKLGRPSLMKTPSSADPAR